MTPAARELTQLEEKIARLRREYDLFLAGNRRGAPIALHDEVEREILRLTRLPASSTATQFRLQALAHRFQALANQVRLRSDPRRRSGGAAAAPTAGQQPSVLLDQAALDNPAAVERHLKQVWGAVRTPAGNGPSLEQLRERLLGEARRHLERPNVCGVRFRVVATGDTPRIRGEIVPDRRSD